MLTILGKILLSEIIEELAFVAITAFVAAAATETAMHYTKKALEEEKPKKRARKSTRKKVRNAIRNAR